MTLSFSLSRHALLPLHHAVHYQKNGQTGRVCKGDEPREHSVTLENAAHATLQDLASLDHTPRSHHPSLAHSLELRRTRLQPRSRLRLLLPHSCLLPVDLRLFHAHDISGRKTSVSTETLHRRSDPRPETVRHCLAEAGKRLRHLPDNSDVPPTHHHKRGSSRWGNCWAGKLTRERPNHSRRIYTSGGRTVSSSLSWHPSSAPRGSA